MSKPSDLWVAVVIVAAVIWLDVPKLLLPAFFLTLLGFGVYRWRRDGRDPLAAERYRAKLLASCWVIGTLSIPLIFQLVPPNGVYGFRTSATRASADIWYSANTFMGWALVAGAVVSAATLLVQPATAKRWQLLATFLVPLFVAVAASFAYLDRLG